jgi:hypothetical protein
MRHGGRDTTELGTYHTGDGNKFEHCVSGGVERMRNFPKPSHRWPNCRPSNSQNPKSLAAVGERPQVAGIAEAVVEDPMADAATIFKLNPPGDGTAGRRSVEALF